MTGPHRAVAAVRVAVRRALADHGLLGRRVLVACSGGTDSLALAAAASFVVPRTGGVVGAVVVDHGLQPGSADVAAAVAARLLALGLRPVTVRSPTVRQGGSGPEDAARIARYAELADAGSRCGAAAVLLGHTRDDQAEQVLLGLARGSGTRSLAGMPASRALPAAPGRGAPVLALRPFLALPRTTTAQACAALGLVPWQDPHNADPRFARVRARESLRLLETSLGPGVAAALARTAALLRDDGEALDDLADTAYRLLGEPPWPAARLLEWGPAVRRRVWRRLALQRGAAAGSLGAGHLLALDALVADWHGQGPIDLPGGCRAGRSGDRVWLTGPAAS